MVKQEMPASIKQEPTLCFSDQVLVLLCLQGLIKGGMFAELYMMRMLCYGKEKDSVQQGKPDP